MKKEKEPIDNTKVIITPPNFKTILFRIGGTAPLVIHKFGQKAREQMMTDQEKGSKKKARGAAKPPKDFDECYNQARHISAEGWDGICASAFKAAMVDACVSAGFFKTRGRISFFILQDGADAEDGTPLVKIIGKPKPHDHMVTIGQGKRDIRRRPMYDPWEVQLQIRYDADVFDETSIANLIFRAGIGGVGEGRPTSKNSVGMGWGTFTILNK
ncbi:MAG: hypothetical protein Q8L84_15060 [Hyphomonas sp.]|nr:hypothetical protein [Hyphomonas sp.]